MIIKILIICAILLWWTPCFIAISRKRKKRRSAKKRRNTNARNDNAKRTYKRTPISKELRLAILNRDNYKCQNPHCTNPHNYGSYDHHTHLHIDHIVPVSKGGSNDPHNLQVLCAECNIKKSNKY